MITDTLILVFGHKCTPKTIKMIHEHTDIKRIRDDIDEPIMDEYAIFILIEKKQEEACPPVGNRLDGAAAR